MDQRCSAITQSASGRERGSWDNAIVSAATREKKPRDKMFCFMILRWVGVGYGWVVKSFLYQGRVAYTARASMSSI